MVTSDDLKQLIKDRDEALLSLDKQKILAYCAKYSIRMPEEDEVFWCGIHKAITGNTGLPYYFRKKSKQWLFERGYMPLDDGDL